MLHPPSLGKSWVLIRGSRRAGERALVNLLGTKTQLRAALQSPHLPAAHYICQA